jgi:putative peptide zinc metalloprotease protein
VVIYNTQNIITINFSSLDYLITLLILYIGTLWHEFGHITACYSYGIKPKNIGFGIYIFFPVLYSDVTSIWLLNRKQRIIVNYAGIYFQLIYISMLYILSLFIGKIIILKAMYLTIISFIPTLNPILRFDGYWLLSDIIGVENLRYNTNKIIEYYRNRFLKRKTVIPEVFSQYSDNKLLFLKFYMIICFMFLIFFYYIIMKEVWFIMKEVWLYLCKTNFNEFHLNWEFANIMIKFAIVFVVFYFLLNRIVRK